MCIDLSGQIYMQHAQVFTIPEHNHVQQTLKVVCVYSVWRSIQENHILLYMYALILFFVILLETCFFTYFGGQYAKCFYILKECRLVS